MTSIDNPRATNSSKMPVKGKKEFPRLHSVNRISRLPVVETSYQYATVVYSKIKNSNSLIRWGLGSVEEGFFMVLDKTLIAVPLIELPLSYVDEIVCKGIDTFEQRVPVITYPPELIVNMTKDYVSSKFIQPVMKRADSVKQLSITGASKYGEMAVCKLDNALDAADKYVDKYLPDTTDSTDSAETQGTSNNKAVETMKHVNRLSRKLQRRLTRRTVAEAMALKKQSVDTMECLLYLAGLAVKDPKQFAEKMKTVWAYLSEDEPENQVPPANLEQLVSMLTREMARRLVHATNFTVRTTSLLPKHIILGTEILVHHLNFAIDYILKVTHLEGGKILVIKTYKEQLTRLNIGMTQLQKLAAEILEALLSQMSQTNKPTAIPLKPISPPINNTTTSNSTTSSPSTPIATTPSSASEPSGGDLKTEEEPSQNSPASPKPASNSRSPNEGEQNQSSESVSNGDTPQIK